jgi:hypothetical protein
MNSSNKDAAFGAVGITAGYLLATETRFHAVALVAALIGGVVAVLAARALKRRTWLRGSWLKRRRLNLARDDAINFGQTRRRHLLVVTDSGAVHHRIWKGSHAKTAIPRPHGLEPGSYDGEEQRDGTIDWRRSS